MEWIFYLAAVALIVLALHDILRKPAGTPHKLLWILVIVFIPLAGAVLYFALGRKSTK
jgi:hypothetical protein